MIGLDVVFAKSGYTAVIMAVYDDYRGNDIGYGYVYTKVDWDRIQNRKIFPEDGIANYYFGYSVVTSVSLAIFGTSARYAEEDHGGSAYIVDDIFVQCITPTPLLQLVADGVTDGDQFGYSVSVFDIWAIIGDPNSDNAKGRACLYK